MTPKITPEMRAALAEYPGAPVAVEDEQTQKRYLLVDAEADRAIAEAWIRQQLQLGLDAAARGEVMPLDAAAIKAAGRKRLGN